MTALLRRPSSADGPPPPAQSPVWGIGAPRLLAGLDRHSTLNWPAHLQTHGELPATDLERLLGQLDAMGPLAGRGGAGFPFVAKLRALAPGRRRIVVNGTESEPASRKDRVLLHRSPHLVLDGALTVATAARASEVVVAVHDELTAQGIRSAVADRPDARGVRVRVIGEGFVSGEARAVVRALDGARAVPPGRRTPPTAAGTLVSNVETFAQLAVLVRMGPQAFAATGTHREPGTTLMTIGGAVGRPGVVEIPIGTPLGIVLKAAQAATNIQAVVVGGYHGAWISPIPEIRLSREGLLSAGGTFGAGTLQVVGDDTCALGELARVAHWLAGESARQCGPCTFGLPALAADVANLYAGVPAVGPALAHARAVTGRGACAHPDGTARFITSALHHLHDETDLHLSEPNGCGRRIRGHLALGGQPAGSRPTGGQR